MDYSYNYGFLREFKELNKLSKKDLLEALGSSDYTGINRWLDGKTPIHVNAMLRLCNYYNIPLDGFFFDGDGESTATFACPTAASQTSPTDGYGIGNGSGKSIVETHITQRQVSSQKQAKVVAEGLARRERLYAGKSDGKQAKEPLPHENDRDEEYRDSGGVTDGNGVATAAMPESEALLRLRLEHSKEIVKLERENHERENHIRRDCQAAFDAERNRLMDIIERQNAELSKIYARQQGRQERGGMMAAESSPFKG